MVRMYARRVVYLQPGVSLLQVIPFLRLLQMWCSVTCLLMRRSASGYLLLPTRWLVPALWLPPTLLSLLAFRMRLLMPAAQLAAPSRPPARAAAAPALRQPAANAPTSYHVPHIGCAVLVEPRALQGGHAHAPCAAGRGVVAHTIREPRAMR